MEEEDRMLGGQPALYGGPKLKNLEDMGPKPCWWTRGVGRRLIPCFNTHTSIGLFLTKTWVWLQLPATWEVYLAL